MAQITTQQKKDEQDLFQLSLEELMNVVVTPAKFPQFQGNVTQKIDVIDADGDRDEPYRETATSAR